MIVEIRKNESFEMIFEQNNTGRGWRWQCIRHTFFYTNGKHGVKFHFRAILYRSMLFPLLAIFMLIFMLLYSFHSWL